MDYEKELLKAKELCNDRPDEALRILNSIMNEDFDGKHGQMALFMSGYLMMQAEKYGLAYHIYKRCQQLNPNISEIYSNMGMCLEQHSPKKAIECFNKATQLNPNNANSYANEGLIYLQMAKPDKCIELCDKALLINPSLKSAIHNKGLAQLMLKDYENGWKNYAYTLGVKHREIREYGLPDWNGEPGRVVVYGEQGVGDEIMFASCLPDMMKTNEVFLDCDSRLKTLFQRSFGLPTYGTRFTDQFPVMEHKPEYQCAIGQLPSFYRKTKNDFPGTPYLTPCLERSLMWRALFDTFDGLKIGIAWSGGIKETGQKKRTLSPSDFESVFNKKDTFICLEYNPVSRETLEKYSLKHYPNFTGKGQDIDELAALISQLDLVITACTTVVYIAGALGVPCHVLVPEEPGYRYGLEGGFDWYYSVKLIRQKGTWKKTIEKQNYDKYLYRLRPKGNHRLSCAMPLNTQTKQSTSAFYADKQI